MLARLVREDDGQDLIEYALVAALISVIAVLAIETVGRRRRQPLRNLDYDFRRFISEQSDDNNVPTLHFRRRAGRT